MVDNPGVGRTPAGIISHPAPGKFPTERTLNRFIFANSSWQLPAMVCIYVLGCFISVLEISLRAINRSSIIPMQCIGV
jgi:hypothetical protein